MHSSPTRQAVVKLNNAQRVLHPRGERFARQSSRTRSGGEDMPYEYILVEKEQGVAILTMNRLDKLNAMNRQLSSELHDAVKQMEADETIGCIVITGAGERAFSAGGDIHEQRENDRTYTQEELD